MTARARHDVRDFWRDVYCCCYKFWCEQLFSSKIRLFVTPTPAWTESLHVCAAGQGFWPQGANPMASSGQELSVAGPSSPKEPERNSAQRLVEHPYFEPFIACVITFNCFELAWESPLDPPGTWKADFIMASELPLLYIFTFEMFMKMAAYGLFSTKYSYLRDPWSCLDFIVVCMAWCACIPSPQAPPLLRPTVGGALLLRLSTTHHLPPAGSRTSFQLPETSRASGLSALSALCGHCNMFLACRSWFLRLYKRAPSSAQW